ncbi:Tc3 transposase [Popillia japonica]|uniref:Tc3 transposase n=1 Tax=Popillia japonica TaxID=7064 RepID=A0AAW1MBH8_POPJA
MKLVITKGYWVAKTNRKLFDICISLLLESMGRRKPLSLIERSKVLALHEAGVSKIEITRRLHRSDHCIRNFLRVPGNYAKPKSQSRPRALSTRDRQHHNLCKQQGLLRQKQE